MKKTYISPYIEFFKLTLDIPLLASAETPLDDIDLGELGELPDDVAENINDNSQVY